MDPADGDFDSIGSRPSEEAARRASPNNDPSAAAVPVAHIRPRLAELQAAEQANTPATERTRQLTEFANAVEEMEDAAAAMARTRADIESETRWQSALSTVSSIAATVEAAARDTARHDEAVRMLARLGGAAVGQVHLVYAALSEHMRDAGQYVDEVDDTDEHEFERSARQYESLVKQIDWLDALITVLEHSSPKDHSQQHRTLIDTIPHDPDPRALDPSPLQSWLMREAIGSADRSTELEQRAAAAQQRNRAAVAAVGELDRLLIPTDPRGPVDAEQPTTVTDAHTSSVTASAESTPTADPAATPQRTDGRAHRELDLGHAAGVTDIGGKSADQRHRRNQDAFAIATATVSGERMTLAIVADGVSHSIGAELAAQVGSEAAAEVLARLAAAAEAGAGWDPVAVVTEAFEAAQQAVLDLIATEEFAETSDVDSPKATIVAVLVTPTQLITDSRGDARAMWISLDDSASRELTEPDTYVRQYMEMFGITEREAMGRPEADKPLTGLGKGWQREWQPSQPQVFEPTGPGIVGLFTDGPIKHLAGSPSNPRTTAESVAETVARHFTRSGTLLGAAQAFIQGAIAAKQTNDNLTAVLLEGPADAIGARPDRTTGRIGARPSRTEYDGAEISRQYHPEVDEFWKRRRVEVIVLDEDDDGSFIGTDKKKLTTGRGQHCFLILRSGKIVTTKDGSAEHPILLHSYISTHADENEKRIHQRIEGPSIVAGGGYWRLVDGRPEIIGFFSGMFLAHATKTPRFWAQSRHRLSQNFDLSNILIEFDNGHIGGAWQNTPENTEENSVETFIRASGTALDLPALEKKVAQHLRGGNEEFWFEVETVEFPPEGGMSIDAIIHPVLGEPAEVTIEIGLGGRPAAAHYGRFDPGPEPARTIPAFRAVHDVLTQWISASGIAWSDDVSFAADRITGDSDNIAAPIPIARQQRAGGSPAPSLPAEVRTCLPWVVDILQRNGLPVLPVTGRRAVHFQTATGSGLQHQPITTRDRSDDPMWKAVDDLRTKPVGTYAVAVVGRGERAHAYIITRRTNPETGLTTTYVHDQLTGGDPRPYLDWKATYTEPEHTYIAYFEPTGSGTLEARTTPGQSQVAPSFEGIDITGAPGRNPDGRSLLRRIRERQAAQTEEQKNLTKFALWSGVAGAGNAGAATYLINAVQQTTGSVDMTAMANALMSSAALAATLPGGMLVDRNARRWMMRAGLLGSVAAGGAALYAGLGLPGTVEALIGAGTVMAATGAVYNAGVQVYGPSLISTPEGRKAADTLMMIDRHSSGLLGRFTWPVMANITAAMPLWASAATGLANWRAMRGLPDTSSEKEEQPSMREVARTMRNDRYMRYYQGLLIPWGVGASAIWVQLAALMDEANYSPQSIGMVAASAGIGTLFGAALKAWKSFREWIKDRTLGLTFGSWMIQAGTLAATDNQWVIAGAVAATGATVMLNNIDFAYYLRNLTGAGLGQGWSITNTVNQVSAIAGSGLVIPAVATFGRTGAGLATAGMFAGATAAALALENGVRRQWWEELRDDCLDRTARILYGLGKDDATAPRGRKRDYKALEKYTKGTLVEYHLPTDAADGTTDPRTPHTPGVFGPLIDQVKNAEETEVDTMDVLVDNGGNTMHVFTIVNTGPGQAIIFDTNIKHAEAKPSGEAEAKPSGEKELHIPRVIDADEFTHPYETIRRIHTARYRRTEDGALEDINKDLTHRDRGNPPRKKRIAGPPEPNERRTAPETSIAAEQRGGSDTSEADSLLHRARGNDEAAFEQLRGKYGRAVFAKVLADLGVPATAVTPELRPLVRVAQGLNRLAFDIADQYRWRVQDAAPLEWLHGIASNLVTGWLAMSATQRGHAAEALAAAQHGGNLTVVQRGALDRLLEAGRREFEAEGKHPSGIDTTAPPDSGVTNRQFMVLQLIAAGMTSRQIGTELGLSPGTVGIYRTELHRRFGARNGAELVYLALSAGVLASTVPVGDRSPATAMLDPTSRELQLLIRIANGDTSHDIAQDLDITAAAVDEQVTDLRRRFDVPNRPAIVLAAVRAGHVELAPPDVEGSAVPYLSPREIDLITRVANGETTKDIAGALGPSPTVVDEYLTRIGNKLRVHNRAAMVAVALRNGMLPDIHPMSRDLADLTSAEVDLLDRVANGQTNTDIANDLETTYGRVDVALAGIRQKLGVRNRQESVAIAIRTGILPGMPTASRATGDPDNTTTPSPTRSQPRTGRSRHIGARPTHSGIPDDAQPADQRPASTPWSGKTVTQADMPVSDGPDTGGPPQSPIHPDSDDLIGSAPTNVPLDPFDAAQVVELVLSSSSAPAQWQPVTQVHDDELLAAAADTDIDLAAVRRRWEIIATDYPRSGWRTGGGLLFRGDERPHTVALAEGFVPLQQRDGRVVYTTVRVNRAADYGESVKMNDRTSRWSVVHQIFVIDAPGGFGVVDELDGVVAVHWPGGLRSERIVGCFEIPAEIWQGDFAALADEVRQYWRPNPRYQPHDGPIATEVMPTAADSVDETETARIQFDSDENTDPPARRDQPQGKSIPQPAPTSPSDRGRQDDNPIGSRPGHGPAESRWAIGSHQDSSRNAADEPRLSEDHLRVLRWITDGWDNARITEALGGQQASKYVGEVASALGIANKRYLIAAEATRRGLVQPQSPLADLGKRLTPRQIVVLAHLSRGRTRGEIATMFGLSPRTVDKHVNRALPDIGSPTLVTAMPRIVGALDLFDEEALARLAASTSDTTAGRGGDATLAQRLSVTEAAVLRQVRQGRTHTEIAAETGMSAHEVRRVLADARRKVGDSDRSRQAGLHAEERARKSENAAVAVAPDPKRTARTGQPASTDQRGEVAGASRSTPWSDRPSGPRSGRTDEQGPDDEGFSESPASGDAVTSLFGKSAVTMTVPRREVSANSARDRVTAALLEMLRGWTQDRVDMTSAAVHDLLRRVFDHPRTTAESAATVTLKAQDGAAAVEVSSEYTDRPLTFRLSRDDVSGTVTAGLSVPLVSRPEKGGLPFAEVHTLVGRITGLAFESQREMIQRAVAYFGERSLDNGYDLDPVRLPWVELTVEAGESGRSSLRLAVANRSQQDSVTITATPAGTGVVIWRYLDDTTEPHHLDDAVRFLVTEQSGGTEHVAAAASDIAVRVYGDRAESHVHGRGMGLEVRIEPDGQNLGISVWHHGRHTSGTVPLHLNETYGAVTDLAGLGDRVAELATTLGLPVDPQKPESVRAALAAVRLDRTWRVERFRTAAEQYLDGIDDPARWASLHMLITEYGGAETPGELDGLVRWLNQEYGDPAQVVPDAEEFGKRLRVVLDWPSELPDSGMDLRTVLSAISRYRAEDDLDRYPPSIDQLREFAGWSATLHRVMDLTGAPADTARMFIPALFEVERLVRARYDLDESARVDPDLIREFAHITIAAHRGESVADSSPDEVRKLLDAALIFQFYGLGRRLDALDSASRGHLEHTVMLGEIALLQDLIVKQWPQAEGRSFRFFEFVTRQYAESWDPYHLVLRYRSVHDEAPDYIVGSLDELAERPADQADQQDGFEADKEWGAGEYILRNYVGEWVDGVFTPANHDRPGTLVPARFRYRIFGHDLALIDAIVRFLKAEGFGPGQFEHIGNIGGGNALGYTLALAPFVRNNVEQLIYEGNADEWLYAQAMYGPGPGMQKYVDAQGIPRMFNTRTIWRQWVPASAEIMARYYPDHESAAADARSDERADAVISDVLSESIPTKGNVFALQDGRWAATEMTFVHDSLSWELDVALGAFERALAAAAECSIVAFVMNDQDEAGPEGKGKGYYAGEELFPNTAYLRQPYLTILRQDPRVKSIRVLESHDFPGGEEQFSPDEHGLAAWVVTFYSPEEMVSKRSLPARPAEAWHIPISDEVAPDAAVAVVKDLVRDVMMGSSAADLGAVQSTAEELAAEVLPRLSAPAEFVVLVDSEGVVRLELAYAGGAVAAGGLQAEPLGDTSNYAPAMRGVFRAGLGNSGGSPLGITEEPAPPAADIVDRPDTDVDTRRIGARPRPEAPDSGSNDREAQWGHNLAGEELAQARGRIGPILPAFGFDDGAPHQPERTVPLAGAQFAADIAQRQLREERAEPATTGQSADTPDRLRDLDATDQLYARLADARREHTAALLRYGYWDTQTVDLSGWRDHDIAENDLFWLSYRQADPGERAQQREAARQYRDARDRLAEADRELTRLVEAAGIDPRQAHLGRHGSLIGALQTFADLVGADWVRRPDHPDFGAAPDDLADSVRARVLRYPGQTYLVWELRRLGPGAVVLVSDTSRGGAARYVLSNIDGTIVEIDRSTGVLREFAPKDNFRSTVEGVFFGPDKRPVHPVGGAWDRIPLFDPGTARQRGAEVTRLHTATAAQQQDGLSELAARRSSVMLKQYVTTAEYRKLATRLGVDPDTLSRQQLDRMAQTPPPPAEKPSRFYLPAPAPLAERLPELVRIAAELDRLAGQVRELDEQIATGLAGRPQSEPGPADRARFHGPAVVALAMALTGNPDIRPLGEDSGGHGAPEFAVAAALGSEPRTFTGGIEQICRVLDALGDGAVVVLSGAAGEIGALANIRGRIVAVGRDGVVLQEMQLAIPGAISEVAGFVFTGAETAVHPMAADTRAQLTELAAQYATALGAGEPATVERVRRAADVLCYGPGRSEPVQYGTGYRRTDRSPFGNLDITVLPEPLGRLWEQLRTVEIDGRREMSFDTVGMSWSQIDDLREQLRACDPALARAGWSGWGRAALAELDRDVGKAVVVRADLEVARQRLQWTEQGWVEVTERPVAAEEAAEEADIADRTGRLERERDELMRRHGLTPGGARTEPGNTPGSPEVLEQFTRRREFIDGQLDRLAVRAGTDLTRLDQVTLPEGEERKRLELRRHQVELARLAQILRQLRVLRHEPDPVEPMPMPPRPALGDNGPAVVDFGLVQERIRRLLGQVGEASDHARVPPDSATLREARRAVDEEWRALAAAWEVAPAQLVDLSATILDDPTRLPADDPIRPLVERLGPADRQRAADIRKRAEAIIRLDAVVAELRDAQQVLDDEATRRHHEHRYRRSEGGTWLTDHAKLVPAAERGRKPTLLIVATQGRHERARRELVAEHAEFAGALARSSPYNVAYITVSPRADGEVDYQIESKEYRPSNAEIGARLMMAYAEALLAGRPAGPIGFDTWMESLGGFSSSTTFEELEARIDITEDVDDTSARAAVIRMLTEEHHPRARWRDTPPDIPGATTSHEIVVGGVVIQVQMRENHEANWLNRFELAHTHRAADTGNVVAWMFAGGLRARSEEALAKKVARALGNGRIDPAFT
ncbi:LuxR C-terminal-related transcriptional regulator [Nocardia sp. NPDC050799]|uniref:LuxR C-terminal-related transcriptional regulator n=1 Tax=Nocardia sp. NPDC050799 TaxID=3154842 RepID=UPI0033D9C6A1